MKLLMTTYKQNLEAFNQPFGIIGLILTHIGAVIVLTPFSTIHQIIKTITPPNDNVNGTLIISYPFIIFAFVMGFLFITCFVLDILDLLKNETRQYIEKHIMKITIIVNIMTILISIYVTTLPIFVFIWLLTAMEINEIRIEHQLRKIQKLYKKIESEVENSGKP